MGEECVTYGKKGNASRILLDKREGKRPIASRGCRLRDVIKIDVKEARWECMEGIHLAQDREKMTRFSEYGLCFTQFVGYGACRKRFKVHLITNLYLIATKSRLMTEL
jgi:hypothetical protein